MTSSGCPYCNAGTVVSVARPGRRWRHRGVDGLEVPADLVLPECSSCGAALLDDAAQATAAAALDAAHAAFVDAATKVLHDVASRLTGWDGTAERLRDVRALLRGTASSAPLQTSLDPWGSSNDGVRRYTEHLEAAFDRRRGRSDEKLSHDFIFNTLLWGDRDGQLVLVEGPPGSGKSTFALNLVAMSLDAGLKKSRGDGATVVVSMQLDEVRLYEGLVAVEARLDPMRLSLGVVERSHWSPLATAAGWLSEAPLVSLCPHRLSIDDLENRCRDLLALQPMKLLVIDGGDFLTGPARPEAEALRLPPLARRLALLARESGATVVITASSQQPLVRFHESADMVISLRPWSFTDRTAAVRGKVTKDRYGLNFDVELPFVAKTIRFAPAPPERPRDPEVDADGGDSAPAAPSSERPSDANPADGPASKSD